MKKIYSVLIATILLTGCGFLDPVNVRNNNDGNNQNIPENNENDQIISYNDYGAFLGRNSDDTTDFDKYNYISLELDEYQDNTIQELTRKDKKIFAYLNVGSIETYRSYYQQFKDFTIGDYENWADEFWMNVTNMDWQYFVITTLAKTFKTRGAFGVYMDNVDVYTYAKENKLDYASYSTALKKIIKGVNRLGLKVMINGGSEFLDDMNDSGDNVFDYIWGYHQEEVYSSILDYNNNIFGLQNPSDKSYYLQIAEMMKDRNKEIFLLEYITNPNQTSLTDEIKWKCESENYHYYIASNVGLY